MLIRARCRKDIFNLYEQNQDLKSLSKPVSDESRDYRWILSVSKNEWIKMAARLACEVRYPNFKSACAKTDQAAKLGALHDIWSIRHAEQRKELPEPLPAKPKSA